MKGVPGTEYIGKIMSHGHIYYNVQKRVEGKYKFFGSAKTLIQALMMRDWVESNNWTVKYPKQQLCNEKYINKRNSGTYVVEKHINGKQRYYGGFNNLEDAIKFRDYCIKKGWSSNCVYENPMKNIRKRHGNYEVKVYFNGKNHYVGTFKSLENAIEVRDLFIKYEGDWDLICEGFENNELKWLDGLEHHESFFQKVNNRGLSDSFWASRGAKMYLGAKL